MFSFLFKKTNKPSEEHLRAYRTALSLFERAMRHHGVNSDQANFHAREADMAERAMRAFN